MTTLNNRKMTNYHNRLKKAMGKKGGKQSVIAACSRFTNGFDEWIERVEMNSELCSCITAMLIDCKYHNSANDTPIGKKEGAKQMTNECNKEVFEWIECMLLRFNVPTEVSTSYSEEHFELSRRIIIAIVPHRFLVPFSSSESLLRQLAKHSHYRQLETRTA